MNIDIRQLRYFLAVAEERSFTRGAERLNMAQPPLSRRIQDLEAAIGAPLFERERRPLRLTSAGRVLYEQATQVIEAMDRLKARMSGLVATPRRRFTLGLVPSVLYARFPEVLAALRTRLPDVELNLAEMDSAEQVRALADGRIDVGFDRIVIDDPQIRHALMREEALAVALPADDPALAADMPLTLAEIAERPLLVYPRNPRPSYADLVLRAFEVHGAHPANVIEVRELQTALVMVAARSGCCIVPESVRRLARPDIGFVAVAEPVRVPLILRARRHDVSPLFLTMLETYDALYRDWGWAVSPELAAWRDELRR